MRLVNRPNYRRRGNTTDRSIRYILSDGSATPWSRRSPVRRSKPLPFNGHSEFSETSRLRALSDKMLNLPRSSRTHFCRCHLRNCLFALSRETPTR
jgi:hypothetical protein